MRFEINKLRLKDTEISFKRIKQYERKYFQHLLKLGLPNNSCLLKYFSRPFFHDGILTKFDLDTLNNKIGIEIVRSDAETEDINSYLNKNNLPEINKKQYLKNPIVYRFDFNRITNCTINFENNSIDSFVIMDCELDKNKNGLLITIAGIEETGLSFNFSNAKCTILNKKALKDHSKGQLNQVPYCNECRSRLMTGNKIKQELINER